MICFNKDSGGHFKLKLSRRPVRLHKRLDACMFNTLSVGLGTDVRDRMHHISPALFIVIQKALDNYEEIPG